jgi:23S rRNA (uracil1939-C5)-methyltransferase
VAFEFSPLKLVYGGDALGHHAGRAVLAPRLLPGERAEVEAVRVAKGVVHARPLRILEAAPQRVDPPCPYFGRCGGCQYQHLNPEHQATTKREILRESLLRLGKIRWDSEIPIRAAPPWNYRNQAQLKVARQPDGKVALGFFEAESHRLFPVDTCRILSPRLNAILAELRSANWFLRLEGCQELELLTDDRDEQAMLTLRGSLSPQEAAAFAHHSLSRLPGVVSVAIEGGRESQVFGERTLTYRVGEFRYRVSPGCFFQASRFLLPELVAAVTNEESPVTAVSGRPPEGSGFAAGAREVPSPRPGGETLAFDLFAGVGLFTLPLAQHFTQVIGVEANAKSAADLAANAQAHALPSVRAVPQTVFDFLRRCAQPQPELVVLDPPRAGVGIRVLKLLLASRPKSLRYVSCSPPTLARDLGYLAEHGYRLNSIAMFDCFPQTYHIESLARLIRNDLARP